MTQQNYLVTGVSGTGKSTVCEELERRGYSAVDTDKQENIRYHHGDDLLWNEVEMKKLLTSDQDDFLFVCGNSDNQGSFYSYFQKIFVLTLPPDLLIQRLLSRTSNNYGKSPEELERAMQYLPLFTEQLLQNGATPIDARQSIGRVLDEIIEGTKK